MLISKQFQGFIFAAVLPELKKEGVVLKFDTPKFQFRTSSVKKESIRNLLKYLDFSYPRNDIGDPLSYTKLNSKQMSDHVQWIEMIAGNSGLEFSYISKEWERLMAQSR